MYRSTNQRIGKAPPRVLANFFISFYALPFVYIHCAVQLLHNGEGRREKGGRNFWCLQKRLSPPPPSSEKIFLKRRFMQMLRGGGKEKAKEEREDEGKTDKKR